MMQNFILPAKKMDSRYQHHRHSHLHALSLLKELFLVDITPTCKKCDVIFEALV